MSGGEQRGLGRKSSQVEVIWDEKDNGLFKLKVSKDPEAKNLLKALLLNLYLLKFY